MAIRLITEDHFNDVIVESTVIEGSGKRQWFLEGVMFQAEKPNRNKRVYSVELLERECNKYQSVINAGRAIGETNHPEYIEPNPKMASHRMVEIKRTGNDFIGKSLVLPTPEGNIIAGLLEGGYKPGVSTRGAGSLSESKRYPGFKQVNDDYMMSCVDIVHQPSGIDCWVDGIYEKAEWVWDNGILVEQAAEVALKQINEKKFAEAFTAFMNEIKVK
jgi:hypothetical protein